MRVCTIIARNYWAHARVLARSVADHHPDARVTVLVIDPDPATMAVAARERFAVIGPDDIGLDRAELLRMAGIYDVLEISTALKPWLLRRLLDEDPEPVIYLDPDIEVFAPLDEVVERASEHSIVLTPHTVAPLPVDDHGPSELTILQAGTYNLGFIAVGSGASGFLDWWAQRLARDCLISKAEGMFVDQKWVDLVPNYFDADVLRDPGYNVAYWNVPGRLLDRGGRGYTVNGRPLRFFHYSGFDPDKPDVLSYYQGDDPRVRLSEHPVLSEICARYADALIRAGHRASFRIGYPFDRTVTGLRLDRRARAVYRRELIAAERERRSEPPNPFVDGTRFERWLNEIVGPQEITRYLRALYDENEELKAAFPDIDGTDARLYVDWVRTAGALHEKIPERLVPRPVVRGDIRGVNLAGYLTAENGVGEAARQLASAFDAAHLDVVLRPYDNTRSRQQIDVERTVETAHPVNIVCVNADQLPFFRADAPDLWDDHRYTVAFWSWETETMPEPMAAASEHADEIWANSEHAARAIRARTDKPVFVCPPPVSTMSVRRRSRSDLGLPEGFLFLFCFDFDSVFERKNPIAVIEAFRRAFPTPCGPQLVVKSVRGEAHPDDVTRLRGAAAGRPDIRLIDGYLDPSEHAAVMAACDAYVSLHRAEGFGFTLAEAMALAKPVIGTAYSGNLEFMDETNSWLVSYELVGIGDGKDPYPADGLWAEPDLDAAAVAMREVVDDPHLAHDRGMRAAADIARLHSPASRAGFLVDRLEAIAAIRHEGFAADDGHPWSAVDSAEHYLSSGPDVESPTRYGFLSRMMRRFVMRFVRHFAEHQDRVQHSLVESVRELQARLASETAAVNDLEAKIRDLESKLGERATQIPRPADVRDLPPVVPAPRVVRPEEERHR